MFDIWWGEIELTTLVLILSVAVLLPVQLLLCFKGKSRMVRLLPMILFSALTLGFVILALINPGWDGLGYTIFAIFTAFLLFVCGVGWGIWAIINHRKKKNDQKSCG